MRLERLQDKPCLWLPEVLQVVFPHCSLALSLGDTESESVTGELTSLGGVLILKERHINLNAY